MPSHAMQDVIDVLRDRRKASASQAPPTLDERRAAFVPGDRLHPVPDDVLVTEVTAGGVPAHWLDAPGADAGRVLLFLHGGGYEFGSLRSDGELAACPTSTSSCSAPPRQPRPPSKPGRSCGPAFADHAVHR